MNKVAPITSTPINSSRSSIGGRNSITRRSLIPQVPAKNCRQEYNDDDAERSSLLANEQAIATSTPRTPTKRGTDSLSSSPQKEHLQGCLKLYTENKINKDNAWKLQLLDFVTAMLKRHDARLNNFTTASTMVDASARIYAFRVDAVHYDALKMAGGLSKAVQSKRGKKDDDNGEETEAPAEGDAGPSGTKKKKKKSRGAIVANPEMLNGDFEANDLIDPFFERLTATAGDVTSSNRAFSATLPTCEKSYGLMIRLDTPFIEPINENQPEKRGLTHTPITLPTRLLPAFTKDDKICAPFTGFSISNWDPDTEDKENVMPNWEENRLNLSQQAVAFDVNGEVEPIPEDNNCNDLLDDEPLGGLESDEEADVAVAACVARLVAPPPRVADLRPSAPHHTRLEYSYCAIVAAWAGPAHWRLKNDRASKTADRLQSARLTNEPKKTLRTKKQPDILGAGLAFDARSKLSDYEPALPSKITISRKTLATGYTWNEANYKTTVDRGLDETHFRKLSIRRNVLLIKEKPGPKQTTEPVTVEENQEYDYNNENDASYCPSQIHEGDEWGQEDATRAGDLHELRKTAETEGLGEMLEPPAKVAKIFIPYAMRAKKVDMKQLKHCTWKMLTKKTRPGQKENVAPTTFADVYHKLPKVLSANMRETLSVPLALLAVLHLTNENGLILKKRDDLKNFDILGLIK